MGLCKNHKSLYFDTLIRKEKAEAVFSLICATYHAKGQTSDEKKKNIARNLVYSYNLFRGTAGSYIGTEDQFQSQYTIGHEMGIWKNSSLELTDAAIQVAEYKMTIRSYLDIALLNYIQPVNGKIVHLLYHLLQYMNTKGKIEVTKEEMAIIYKTVSGATENGEINGAFNLLLGSNYFSSLNSSTLQYVYSMPINTLMSMCNTKYITEGYEQAQIDLNTQEKYALYLLQNNNNDSENISSPPILEKNDTLQQIFYGAPGTGKSHTINNITEAQPKENVFRTTFHPDSDYSTFVGAYKPTKLKSSGTAIQPILDYDSLVDKFKEYLSVPNANITKVCTQFGFDYHDSIVRIQEQGRKVMDLVNDAYKNNTSYDSVVRGGMACYEQVSNMNKGTSITYEFVPQSFTKAYVRAWQTDEPVYLVIEEINRGNCAQIFGDLFQLLDRKDGFSEYPIKADNDLAQYLSEQFFNNSREDIPENVKSGEELVLPNNLYIWATMNTSDQSLFPIDSAFKRRWDWKYVPISNARENWKIEVNNKRYDWWNFLEKINKKIEEATNSEDKKLGYFFCKATNGIINAETFVGKVIFYIWNDVFKDFADEAGSLFKDIDNSTLSFNKFYTVDGIGNAVINEAKVALFLQNLGVNASNEEENDDEEDETSNETNSKHKHLRSVVFSDGTIFSKEKENIKTQFDIYLESLKKIGLDTVCPLIAEMKYQRKGCPMVSTEKQPDILESNTYEYHQEGKYYIVKGANDDTLINILEELKAQLNLDIEINFE